MRMQKNWGEGTVYQESGNKWTAKISLGTTPDGKALFKRFNTKSKAGSEKVSKSSLVPEEWQKDLSELARVSGLSRSMVYLY